MIKHSSSGLVQKLQKIGHVQLTVGGAAVASLACILDLVVTLNSQLSMKQHVFSGARSCFYQLRRLRSMTFDGLRPLVHRAFAISRMDSCNAVLHGVAAYVTRRLQPALRRYHLCSGADP